MRRLAQLDASIVIASGNIDYAKPVHEDLVTTCNFGEHTAQMDTLAETGKARFELACEVTTADGAAAVFRGNYAVRLNR